MQQLSQNKSHKYTTIYNRAKHYSYTLQSHETYEVRQKKYSYYKYATSAEVPGRFGVVGGWQEGDSVTWEEGSVVSAPCSG